MYIEPDLDGVAAAELDESSAAPAITDACLLSSVDKAASFWCSPGWWDQKHVSLGLKFEGRPEWFIVGCRVGTHVHACASPTPGGGA